jgi:DNA replication protein DnaC
MSTTSYQKLRSHLTYLNLVRAEEVLAAHVEQARKHQLSHVTFLERLLAAEVEATIARRLRGRLRFAHSRSKSVSTILTSTFNLRSTRS